MVSENFMGGNTVGRHKKNQFLFVALVLCFAALIPLVCYGQDKGRRPSDGSIEGWVSYINKDVLFIDGQEYRLSETTRVFLGEGDRWEVTLKTITDVGHIDKARIYLERGAVQKIIVLEVQQ